MIFVEGWMIIFVKDWMIIFDDNICWRLGDPAAEEELALSAECDLRQSWGDLGKMTKSWDLVKKYYIDVDEINLAGLWPLQLQLTART